MDLAVWDYLIVTASNERQAQAYESQLAARSLPRVRRAMVVADPGGRRIGSGASTLACLRRVLREQGTLDNLRVLIVHAGGDSRRLPAYGPAGKIFIPVPGEPTGGVPATLFDLLVPSYLRLTSGRIVVTSGDALLQFDASTLVFAPQGFTIVAAPATPEEAARHGVVCAAGERLRLYLQKPSITAQAALGAIGREGNSLLDIGVMSFDAAAAGVLLAAFGECGPDWSADLYREICCAFGEEATLAHYIASARASGSNWSDAAFAVAFPKLNAIPVSVRVVPHCRFLHFGSTRQLIESGAALQDGDPRLAINNRFGAAGSIAGESYWVEGCRIEAPLTLDGSNVVIGADVEAPLHLARGAALDVVRGEAGWFVRPYGIGDSFKAGGTFVNRPMEAWLRDAGVGADEVWDSDDRTLWTARVFPLVAHAGDYREWLWFYDPSHATAAERARFLEAKRYSAAEIALLADQEAFHARRGAIG